MSENVHAPAPSVGSVEVTMPPLLSTAIQKGALVQVTASRPLPSTPVVTLQAEAPLVGSVDVRTLPRESTATHRVTVGHEVDAMNPAGSRNGSVIQSDA